MPGYPYLTSRASPGIRYATLAGGSTLPSAYLRAALPAHIKLRGGSLKAGAIKSDPTAAATKVYTVVRPKRRRVNDDHHPLKLVGPLLSRSNGEDSLSAGDSSCAGSLTTASAAAAPLFCSSTHGRKACGGSAARGGGKQNISHRSGGGGESDGGGSGGSGGGGDGKSGASCRVEEQRTADGGASAPDGQEGVADNDTVNTLSVLGSTPDCRSHPGEISPRVVSSHEHSSVGRHDGSGVLGTRGEVGPSSAGTRKHGCTEWERGWDCDRERRGLTGDGRSRFPGSSVRQAMPSGLGEVVERFCAAAFLRGHVPQGLMPAGTPPEEAYQR